VEFSNGELLVSERFDWTTYRVLSSNWCMSFAVASQLGGGQSAEQVERRLAHLHCAFDTGSRLVTTTNLKEDLL
jgi:hypothetical protein